MLTLYREPQSRLGDEIEERLQDLVLAHEVVTVTAGDETAPDVPLPAVAEGDEVYSGRAAIGRLLDEIGREVAVGRLFQSDACYVDPDSPGQCL